MQAENLLKTPQAKAAVAQKTDATASLRNPRGEQREGSGGLGERGKIPSSNGLRWSSSDDQEKRQ